ncbi:MAG: DUF5820 family protein [Halobacteriales archaeon]|nr:DUF5820 family protein [Halobacteriales archaeon]
MRRLRQPTGTHFFDRPGSTVVPHPVPEDLPHGWEIWNDEPDGQFVIVYRPDIFDAEEYPSACLPTITAAPGRSPDDPPERRARSDAWHVGAYLEPAVRLTELEARVESRDEAVAWALIAAGRFSDGDVDVNAAYQIPRQDYLAKLDELLHHG